MRPNLIEQRLQNDRLAIGLSHSFGSPGVLEYMGEGWDFVWIDGQHGAYDVATMTQCIRTAELAGLGTLLRVPTHDPGWLGVFADLDPDAVMLPMVNNVEQALAVVRALRFPPAGQRSYGGRRVIDRNGRDFYKTRKLTIIAQIETVEADANVQAIADTAGIDGLFFGPDDMKVQLGIDVNAPAHEQPAIAAAMRRMAESARRAGKFAAGVAPSPAVLKLMADMGYRMLVGGGDGPFLKAASAARLKELSEARSQLGASRPAPASPASSGSAY